MIRILPKTFGLAAVLSASLVVASCTEEAGRPTGSGEPTGEECFGTTCNFDQVCDQEQQRCVNVPCDPEEGDGYCHERFNPGFTCQPEEGSPLGGVCTAGADYCTPSGGFACPTHQECVNYQCVERTDSCSDGGHSICIDAGQYCSEDEVCAEPNTDCQASADSGVTWMPGAPLIWGLEEIDLEDETEFAQGGASAPDDFDFCPGAGGSAHAWRVGYYDPDGGVPTVTGRLGAAAGNGLYQRLLIHQPGGSTSPVGAVVPGADPSADTFVFYACVLDSTASGDDVWALVYREGALTSDAVCFDIN